MDPRTQYSYAQLLELPPKEMFDWLLNEFHVDLPNEIMTIDEMKLASKLLIKLSSYQISLNSLWGYAKIAARNLKRQGDQEAYEDMADRRDIIKKLVDSIDQAYSAISRAVTIKSEINQELRMNTSGSIPVGDDQLGLYNKQYQI